MPIKLIDSTQYHLWADALHARQLARTTKDEWDRGAYVRWAVNTAWTAFENYATDLLSAQGLGMRFKKRFDDALAANRLPKVNWGSGVWQRALAVYQLRKDFTHVAAITNSAVLRPPIADAEKAIETMREAVKALAAHAGAASPPWVEDDGAAGFGSRTGDYAIGVLTMAGADPEHPETVRITYVWEGKEYVDLYAPPGTAWEPLLDRLQGALNVPATAIRAYRGQTLLSERLLNARRSE
ncbi:hypothetical protein [Anaeromyxobacter sp. Fw109-5]|uniref:hypothetical protein n=1 Tax=Anaeromyxobacter sp. (strain Fw109-5) TaxID=404589 RepID=UPI0002F3AD38|nr:hypothetical protein [Anaeromyxobacter sp. Fw109-5]